MHVRALAATARDRRRIGLAAGSVFFLLLVSQNDRARALMG